jgi:long-chain acyl-CoA synthetase
VLRAGMVVVNTNPLYTPRELEHQLKDSGAKAIVIVENFAHVLQEVLPRTDLKNVLVTGVGDLLGVPKGFIVNFVLRHVRKQVPAWRCRVRVVQERLGQRAGLKIEPVPWRRGHRLPAIHGRHHRRRQGRHPHPPQHGGQSAAILAWIRPACRPAARIVITALPLYHIFALTSNCLAFCRWARAMCLITNPRDFPAFVNGTEKIQIQFHQRRQYAVQRPAAHARIRDRRLQRAARHLRRRHGRAVGRGGALEARSREHLTQGWGLTETSPMVTANPIGLISTARSACRCPRPTFPSAMMPARNCPSNGVGEICVFGPQVMRGYWNRPDETEKVMFGDWLRTGDIGAWTKRASSTSRIARRT